MAIFIRMRGNEPGDDMKAAVLTPTVLTACADGEQTPEEAEKIASIIQFSPIFKDDTPLDIDRILSTVMEAWRGNDTGALIAEMKVVLPMPLRETAIAFAMRIAAADGEIHQKEADAIVHMAQSLEIPEATYDKRADVVMILQRCP